MATPTPHPAFIDSNLDTHLALIVSGNDTVSDIKDKIEKEHQLCFPQLGNIKVHGVKVKRKGYYYHLSDSMTVQSAFYGVSNWFLHVDVSSACDHSQNHQSYNPVCGNLLTGYDINNVALMDGVDLASGLCPKRSPNLDETQLQLDVNEQFVKAKARIAEKEVLESKRIEGERSIDNVFESRSPDVNSREDLGIPIVCRPRDREPEVRNALSTDIEVSCGKKRENAEYNESLDDKATGKEKCKRKKGMKELMDDHADIDNSICENGVDISQQEVASKNETCRKGPEQISKGIKIIANEPCHSSSSDTLKRSSCRFQSNNICERTEITDELVISKTSDLLSENLIRVPQYSPASKKAKKGNNLVERGQYLKANGVLVSEFNEESAKHITISEQSGSSNKCSVKTALDGLSAEPLENVCDSGTSSSSGKKKKKKTKHKPSNLSSQVAVAISSPSKDNKGQMSSLTTGIQMKVTREADVIDNIPVHITQDAAGSSFPRISAVEMHYSNASSIHSSFDVDIRNSNIYSGERIRDAPEKEAVFGIERIINAKDNQIIDAKGETNQTDGVTEDVIYSQISDKPLPFEKCISSGPNEVDVIVNEVITSLGLLESKKIDNANPDKKKKRRKLKICDQDTPFKAVIEDGKGNEHDNSPIRLHKRVSCSVPLSQTMSEEVASAFIACRTDQNGVTKTITPSLINENRLPSGKCISSEQNAADLTMKEENVKKINESADPDRKKKKKKSKSRSGDRLLKSVDKHARGKEHCNSFAGPDETVNSNVCSEKTTAVEMNFARNPSEEVANAILALTRSGVDGTSVDLVEASQSNEATMMEKKDEKMRKKSKKSSAHDRNGSEALALSSPDLKIPKGVVNHDIKGLEKDVLDVQHLTSRKTSVENNRKVNHAGGKEHCNSSARPDETVNSNVCSEKTTAVEMNFARNPSEEVANAILALTRSGVHDTSVYLVEASQSNGATMMEKKDEKMRKKSKKSSAHDRNGSEALALSSPDLKIPKGAVNHDQKGLEKDAVDVQHLTSSKTSVKNNRKVNHARGKELCNSSARPDETVNSNVCSKKTTAVEMNFSQSPSEEVANTILALTRSGVDDTSVDLVEASQSNGATMMEKRDEKMKKKSKKSSAHDKNGTEALALSSPNVKIPKGVVNHDIKGLDKDALDVQHLTSRKTSVKNNRKVNRLEGRKSLLTKSGRIFKDASSDSSLDEDLVANADATINTPNNSFSSDHSDNESNANMNLAQNGFNDLEKKLLDDRNNRNTESTSAAKSMTLDRILRSSSRYRKAKITAIESQLEDTNSQPVDMVPDSQPNL